jgi:hypothetical protein
MWNFDYSCPYTACCIHIVIKPKCAYKISANGSKLIKKEKISCFELFHLATDKLALPAGHRSC